jgi:hypothetical protein
VSGTVLYYSAIALLPTGQAMFGNAPALSPNTIVSIYGDSNVNGIAATLDINAPNLPFIRFHSTENNYGNYAQGFFFTAEGSPGPAGLTGTFTVDAPQYSFNNGYYGPNKMLFQSFVTDIIFQIREGAQSGSAIRFGGNGFDLGSQIMKLTYDTHNVIIGSDTDNGQKLQVTGESYLDSGNITTNGSGNITATSFITTDGTSSQVVLGDGNLGSYFSPSGTVAYQGDNVSEFTNDAGYYANGSGVVTTSGLGVSIGNNTGDWYIDNSGNTSIYSLAVNYLTSLDAGTITTDGSGNLTAATLHAGNGYTGTITTARLTPVTGAQGSQTFVDGILVSQVQAT